MRAPPTATTITPHGVGVWLENFVADETFDGINDTGGRFVADDLCVVMPSIWSGAVLTVTVDRPAYDKNSSLSMTYTHLSVYLQLKQLTESLNLTSTGRFCGLFLFHSRLMQSSVVTRTQV
jgi:hypothetical protein